MSILIKPLSIAYEASWNINQMMNAETYRAGLLCAKLKRRQCKRIKNHTADQFLRNTLAGKPGINVSWMRNYLKGNDLQQKRKQSQC
jgi:hypothetical protein